MPENGQFGGVITLLYGILAAVAIGTGFLAIATALFSAGGFIDLSFLEILQMIIDKIILQI